MEPEKIPPPAVLVKTCKRGHEYAWERKRCPVCIRARNEEWRAANRDIVNRINRESYRRAHPLPAPEQSPEADNG